MGDPRTESSADAPVDVDKIREERGEGAAIAVQELISLHPSKLTMELLREFAADVEPDEPQSKTRGSLIRLPSGTRRRGIRSRRKRKAGS